MDDLFTVLLAAMSGFTGSLLTYLNTRRKTAVERITAAASAKLSEAQAADLIIENLAEQYQTVVTEMSGVRAEMAALRTTVDQQSEEIGTLRTQVARLTRRLASFEKVVRSLPTEIQSRFAEVMSASD